MQRRPAARRGNVGICTVSEQHLDRLQMPMNHGGMQRRQTVTIMQVEISTAREQLPHRSRMTIGRCVVQRGMAVGGDAVDTARPMFVDQALQKRYIT